ncbi:MAG: hypothetical protein RL097_168 [Candidatus Parcubacteria bacterium]|jgi:uncharacterized membrane protein YqjE
MTKTPTTYSGLVEEIITIINLIIPAIFAIIFVYFVWKVIDAWIINAGDEKKRAEGKQYAMIAVLVFVLMVSAWGIVAMVKSSLFGA